MNAARALPAKELKIVVIGGGSGSSTVLQGLKSYTSQVTAVVTMFDSGGSSGLLQVEFGYPPLGDLRQCLLGLSEQDLANKPLRELLDFRFQQESSLNGHSLGNLLLAALTTIGKDLELAIDELAQLLRVRGQVVPVSLERADLCAKLSNGDLLRGEANIDLRRQRTPRIERVYLDPVVNANPKAVKAILDADVVVLGPGDLYTSILPNLLVKGISEALSSTKAIRVYVCNLMTKLGETDGFRASDFVHEITKYLGGPNLDWALVNTRRVPRAVREAYLAEGAHPVVADLKEVQQYVPCVSGSSLANDQVPSKHESHRIAEAVTNIASLGRTWIPQPNGNGQHTQPITKGPGQVVVETGGSAAVPQAPP